MINEHTRALAIKYPAVKFIKSLAEQCIPNYPDHNLPTIFIHLNGELKKQLKIHRPAFGPLPRLRQNPPPQPIMPRRLAQQTSPQTRPGHLRHPNPRITTHSPSNVASPTPHPSRKLQNGDRIPKITAAPDSGAPTTVISLRILRAIGGDKKSLPPFTTDINSANHEHTVLIVALQLTLLYHHQEWLKMKPNLKVSRFGELAEITGKDYVQEVNKAGDGIWVVLHLYIQGLGCNTFNSSPLQETNVMSYLLVFRCVH